MSIAAVSARTTADDRRRRPFDLGRIGRRTLLAGVLLVNAVLLAAAVHGLLFGERPPPDWTGVVIASQRILGGADPYVDQVLAFRWSPLAAWLFVPIAAAGFGLWQVLHVAVLAALSARLAIVTLACFAFWTDVAMGNVVTFGFVLAYLALSGNRLGILGFAVFALLVPRPLYIPVLIWIWIHQPTMRWPLVLVAVAITLLTLATGFAESWVSILLSSTGDIANPTNMAPSRLIGLAWVPIGIALGIVALRRGRIGLASLLFSPYWLPYYFLMVLLDFVPADRRRAATPASLREAVAPS